jgi:hypothetical protein
VVFTGHTSEASGSSARGFVLVEQRTPSAGQIESATSSTSPCSSRTVRIVLDGLPRESYSGLRVSAAKGVGVRARPGVGANDSGASVASLKLLDERLWR